MPRLGTLVTAMTSGDASSPAKFLGYPLAMSSIDLLLCDHQREEVVQHMPDNLYGTLEVVGR